MFHRMFHRPRSRPRQQRKWPRRSRPSEDQARAVKEAPQENSMAVTLSCTCARSHEADAGCNEAKLDYIRLHGNPWGLSYTNFLSTIQPEMRVTFYRNIFNVCILILLLFFQVLKYNIVKNTHE